MAEIPSNPEASAAQNIRHCCPCRWVFGALVNYALLAPVTVGLSRLTSPHPLPGGGSLRGC